MIAGCQSRVATNGSGYQFVRFKDPQAARLASQDETAGPAINSNNRQCAADAACRKWHHSHSKGRLTVWRRIRTCR